jgi:hypothetical protein
VRHPDLHVADQDLLALADHELSATRAQEVRTHLETCWTCRTRMREIDETIAHFVHLHHDTLDTQVPPAEGPRALLRARLAEMAQTQPARSTWLQFANWKTSARALSATAACFLLLMLGLIAQRQITSHELAASRTHSATGSIPNRKLTPGAIRSVRITDVCSQGHSDKNREVPVNIEQKVFQEYGMSGVQEKDYEVDYLITPELGGSDDIQNLWPEPYTATDWSAYVKDALEDRLHQMVCTGQLDLPTAQHEISTDWISAYKKYFHTEKPLQHSAALTEQSMENRNNKKNVGTATLAGCPISRVLCEKWGFSAQARRSSSVYSESSEVPDVS